ncbi:hypothetical protein PTKIN_Ptkin14bG0040800 [Pterospermum kingtungense]
MMMIGGNNQMSSATQNEGGDGSSSSAGGMNNNHNNGGGGGGGGEGGGGGGVVLKKGPWTAAEDAVLADYVRTHGEGNWNAVQKNTGLARCGKSCRLRWANHLRPNLKKGSFSPEEERIIVELHAKMGNKWARMATQLPGRTDNEIKNYWNTRVKRRQRQGLPLYPPDIQPLYSQHQHHHSTPTTPLLSPSNTPTSSFSFQTTPTTTTTTMSLHSSMLTPLHPLHIPRSESQPLLCNPHTAPTPSPLPSPSPSTPPPLPSPSPSTPPHASPLQSPHRPTFSTLPLFDYSTSHTCNNNTSTTTNVTNTSTPSDFFYPRTSPTLQTPIRYKRFRHDASESNNNNHHNLNVAVNNGSCSTGSSFMVPFSPFMKSAVFNPHIGAVTTSTTSLASPQYTSYSLDPITLDLASSSRILRPHFDSGQLIPTPGYVYPSKMELPSNQLMSHGGNFEVTLDHTKGNNDYSSHDHSINHQNFSMNTSGSGLLEDMLEEAQVLADNNDIMRRQGCLVGFSSTSDSVVFKAKEETPEQMNTTTQEDYNRLLNPSSMAIPEWYNDSGEGSNGQSSVITDDNQGLDLHHLASLLPVDIAPDHHHGRSPSSRSWENFL